MESGWCGKNRFHLIELERCWAIDCDHRIRRFSSERRDPHVVIMVIRRDHHNDWQTLDIYKAITKVSYT
jgi:hypothetical protein